MSERGDEMAVVIITFLSIVVGAFIVTLLRDAEFRNILKRKWYIENSMQRQEIYNNNLRTFGNDLLVYFWHILQEKALIDNDIEPCNVIEAVSDCGFCSITFKVSQEMMTNEKWTVFKNQAISLIKRYDKNVELVKIDLFKTRMTVSWNLKKNQ